MSQSLGQSSDQISGVATNIITGFLGVGKTSAILHLLKTKPTEERWAVLVNEFGEIGLDGALLEGRYSEQQGVFIREVPGGCMCCTAGLPMRVALTQLLRRARPDRLLIEASGLGHPEEVLQTLNDDDFQGVIAMQKVITLVDARHFSDQRYVEHKTFQQQIAIADIIIGNKEDLYTEKDRKALKLYLEERATKTTKPVFTEQGRIDFSLFDSEKNEVPQGAPSSLVNNPELSNTEHKAHLFNAPFPDCGYIKAINQGEGFFSVGWRFSSRFEFDRNSLFIFLSGMNVERLKATFLTNEGCFAYNLTKDSFTEMSFDYLDESRIEIITREQGCDWESELFDCLQRGDLGTLKAQ